MTIHVIILAQGTQQRLGMAHGYKQMLRLPACGIGILHRTLIQIARINPHVEVRVVGWDALTAPLVNLAFPFGIRGVELPSPGNSSLKGIARYLEARGERHDYHHTIVLLGDVVYSWACLEAIWGMTAAYGWVGTSGLSESGGELWGVAWSRGHEPAMIADLRDALLRHPPFEDEYQPGQMRRWIMGWRRGALRDRLAKLQPVGIYRAVDDYTMDVDLPHHIPLLEAASQAALRDDEQHGLAWHGRILAPSAPARQMTAQQFAALPPRSRGYAVYMSGARKDEPHVPDERNPYPSGSDDAEEWSAGNRQAVIDAQDGDDE